MCLRKKELRSQEVTKKPISADIGSLSGRLELSKVKRTQSQGADFPSMEDGSLLVRYIGEGRGLFFRPGLD